MKLDLNTIFTPSPNGNDKVHTALLSAIANSFIKEFDYLKFLASVSKLEKMGMDKATSFKSAFATAQTMGISKEKLIRTAIHYQASLTREKEKFATALKKRISSDIDKRTKDKTSFSKTIVTKTNQIKELQKEIEILNKKIDHLDFQVGEASKRIDERRTEFKNTYESLYNKIENDIEFIDNQL